MNKSSVLICILTAMLCCACHKETAREVQQADDAAFNVLLSGISSYVSVDSKATPSGLEIPVPEQFNVRIVRNSNGAVILDRLYSKELFPIDVVSGTEYTITAEYGENDVLALNKPYYRGSTVESVLKGQTKDISIPCSVGNSLISARFGSTPSDSLLFDRYFEDCVIAVTVGDNMVYLPFSDPEASAYLRAGSEFKLIFIGVVRTSGETRSFDLPADKLPSSLSAAEHLVVTLDIKSESALDVTVTKADVINTEIGQSIPYIWLPVPDISTEHKFDGDGILEGTDIIASESFPGCEWTAHIWNPDGIEVRTINGTGSLKSSFGDSDEWPYLPSGDYYATFSYEYDGRTIEIEGRRKTFSIAPPDGLKATASGYTSYDRYRAGDISGANSCDAGTLYNMAVRPGISDAIRLNGNYRDLIESISGSVWVDGDTGRKSFTGVSAGSIAGLDTGAHSCNATFTFDGTELSASFPFVITGLPYTAAPPSDINGWKIVQGGNKVKFGSTYMSIADGGTVTADPTVQSPSFFCPSGEPSININVSADGTLYTRNVLFNYHCELHIYQASERIHSQKSSSTDGNPLSYSENRIMTPESNYFRIDAAERTELSGFARITGFNVIYRK